MHRGGEHADGTRARHFLFESSKKSVGSIPRLCDAAREVRMQHTVAEHSVVGL